MKSQKLFLGLVILFAASRISFGQEKPQAILFNESVNEFCSEIIKANIDNLGMRLNEEPNSKAYIIGYGDASIQGRFQHYQDAMLKAVTFRKYGLERFVFLRGKNQDKMIFQYWVAPNNADAPKPEGEYKFEKLTSATLFDNSEIQSIVKNRIMFGDGANEPCDYGLNLEGFADYLKSESELNGYFVAYSKRGKDKISANRALNVVLRNFISTYKIPRSRLKILEGENRAYNQMDIWLIPKGKLLSLKELSKSN